MSISIGLWRTHRYLSWLYFCSIHTWVSGQCCYRLLACKKKTQAAAIKLLPPSNRKWLIQCSLSHFCEWLLTIKQNSLVFAVQRTVHKSTALKQRMNLQCLQSWEPRPYALYELIHSLLTKDPRKAKREVFSQWMHGSVNVNIPLMKSYRIPWHWYSVLLCTLGSPKAGINHKHHHFQTNGPVQKM